MTHRLSAPLSATHVLCFLVVLTNIAIAITIQVRVDEEMKLAVETLLSSLGLDISTAVRMFFAKTLAERGLPFEVKQSGLDPESRQAIEDVEQRRNLTGPFHTVAEAMAYLNSDEEEQGHTLCVAEHTESNYPA